jgi:hypothetical protein
VKLANCPTHGRNYLANAGAPNIVRCMASAGCPTGGTIERCRNCAGTGVDGRSPEWIGCCVCTGLGWRPRRSPLGSAYPVS